MLFNPSATAWFGALVLILAGLGLERRRAARSKLSGAGLSAAVVVVLCGGAGRTPSHELDRRWFFRARAVVNGGRCFVGSSWTPSSSEGFNVRRGVVSNLLAPGRQSVSTYYRDFRRDERVLLQLGNIDAVPSYGNRSRGDRGYSTIHSAIASVSPSDVRV